MLTDQELRILYGKNIIITRLGPYVLAHLDNPTAEVVEARTNGFNPKEFFVRDCPVCEMTKHGGVIIFDIEDDYAL